MPKIPSMRIIDLAKAIAPSARIVKIGIRPGEKLNEALIMAGEARYTREFDDRFEIKPNPSWLEQPKTEGKPLPDGFEYASDKNNHWLSRQELEQMLKNL